MLAAIDLCDRARTTCVITQIAVSRRDLGRGAGDPTGIGARRLDGVIRFHGYPEPVGEVALGGHGAGHGEIPKYGTAQPTIFWNAGAATEPP